MSTVAQMFLILIQIFSNSKPTLPKNMLKMLILIRKVSALKFRVLRRFSKIFTPNLSLVDLVKLFLQREKSVYSDEKSSNMHTFWKKYHFSGARYNIFLELIKKISINLSILIICSIIIEKSLKNRTTLLIFHYCRESNWNGDNARLHNDLAYKNENKIFGISSK